MELKTKSAFAACCMHKRFCINNRLDPDQVMAVPKPQSLAKDIMKKVKQSYDNAAKAAADMLGLEGIACILRENECGIGQQTGPENLRLNPLLFNCIWLTMQATLLMRERFGRLT